MIQSRTRSARFLFILLAGTTLIFYGCDDEGGPPDPEISSISPTSGPPGATVTIDGTGFSEESSENKVTFGGTRADVTSASTSSLQATVPEEATTGAVEVFVRGELAVGPELYR